jgi:hypothetical protein
VINEKFHSFEEAFSMKQFGQFPHLGELLPVYGLITLAVYGWSLYRFSWIVPSWINILTVGEIAIVLAYIFSVNFLESLLAMGTLIFISFVLPSGWFRKGFVLRAGICVIFIMIFLIYLNYKEKPLDEAYRYMPIVFVLLVSAILVVERINFARKWILDFVDRASIFSYLTIPLSVIALIVVIVRNI